MDRNQSITDPKLLVRREFENLGLDLDKLNIPKRVYLLADDLFDCMLEENCGTSKFPLAGNLYVFNNNPNVGFIAGNMCAPAIATQAEDLIAGGVKELIHIGYAGALQTDMQPGDIVVTDGAYNDTAVAKLYGYDYDKISSTKRLTDEIAANLTTGGVAFRRGIHWTTDAGYRETWGQVLDHREMGAQCVEMEGVGLFTIANYRNCAATAIYICSDVVGEEWQLGWGENRLDDAKKMVITQIIKWENKIH